MKDILIKQNELRGGSCNGEVCHVVIKLIAVEHSSNLTCISPQNKHSADSRNEIATFCAIFGPEGSFTKCPIT